MFHQSLSRFAGVLICCCSVAGAAEKPGTQSSGVQITQLPDRLHVEINGKLFTEYFFKDVPRPYCYPIIGPGGVAMTRNWPMKNIPDLEPDKTDHPHHRSLWFAHGLVNGYDFWSEDKKFGKTVHEGFDEVQSGEKVGVIKSHNNWVAPDGKVVCTDKRTIRIYAAGSADERMIDFEITLHAPPDAPVTFGDTKEGMMAVRVASTMRLTGKVGKGHIVTSTGVRDDETWGKQADWCDYYGPAEGKTVGFAIFDHPENPRHPTWWHVRDYGLFAANPFGKHDFENLKDNKTAGNLTVAKGESITFKYRILMHAGDEKAAKVAEKYEEYVKQKKSK
jgi:hypothetical protein